MNNSIKITVFLISNDSLCGSIIYDDVKLFGTDREAKALVSYCYTKESENENINFEVYNDNPKKSTIETTKINKNLNYVLTVKIPKCSYNYFGARHGFGLHLQYQRKKFPFGSVEWVNCDQNKIRFFDFNGSYESESILNNIDFFSDFLFYLLPLKDYSYLFETEIIKIFAVNMKTKPSMSKPKTTLQSFSLPENELKSDLKFKQGKA